MFYKKSRSILFTLLSSAIALSTFAQADDDKLAVDKISGDLSVLVLGSGGPLGTPKGRASAGYLIYIDGKATMLMDAGGGTFNNIAKAGANIKDLETVLLTHMHADHTTDLPSIIKTMYFQNRVANLADPGTPPPFPPGRMAKVNIYGPAANGVAFPPDLGANPATAQYPATSAFADGHFDLNTGINRYLNIFTRAISAGIFGYTTTDVPPDWMTDSTTMLTSGTGMKGEYTVKSIGVNHGPVPSVAFRIDYNGKSIVYSGDTSSKGVNMISLATGADILIYDTALEKDAPNPDKPAENIFFALHTTPTRIGEVAAKAGVKKLVLSHITPGTEPNIDAIEDLIEAAGFTGKIKTAKDLKVYNVDD